jgi:hypothetical protein
MKATNKSKIKIRFEVLQIECVDTALLLRREKSGLLEGCLRRLNFIANSREGIPTNRSFGQKPRRRFSRPGAASSRERR